MGERERGREGENGITRREWKGEGMEGREGENGITRREWKGKGMEGREGENGVTRREWITVGKSFLCGKMFGDSFGDVKDLQCN